MANKFTLDHFKAKYFSRQTISGIIKRAEKDSGHDRVKGSGSIAKKINQNI